MAQLYGAVQGFRYSSERLAPLRAGGVTSSNAPRGAIRSARKLAPPLGLRLILWAWPRFSEGLPGQLSEHLVLPCRVTVDVRHDDAIGLPARHTCGSTKAQLVSQVHKGIDLPGADSLPKLLAITLAIDQFMATRHRPLGALCLAGTRRLDRP
jgi:hypothetical protein